MGDAIAKGIILGLTLAMLVGPVFFALLQVSIDKGFKAGASLALGIILSDTIYIIATNFFVVYLLETESIEFYLGLVGGIILIIFGVVTGLQKPKKKPPDPTGNDENILDTNLISNSSASGFQPREMLKGFLINFAHPGVLIFWIGVVSLISTQFVFEPSQKIALYSTTIITVFSTDLLKAFLAHKIRNLISVKILLWLNRIMGIVLIAFGIHLLLITL